MNRTEVLADGDLPELFASANAASLSAQRRFVRSTMTQLVLLVVAAAGGALSVRVGDTDWAQLAAAAAFFTAAILKTHVLATKPDVVWYEGRAAAESAKTLAWRYAVGGHPFPVEGSRSVETDKVFLARLREVLKPLKGLPLVPPSNRVEQITEKMRRLRSQSLEERKVAYAQGRVVDQRTWYTRSAASNEHRASLWNALMLGFEAAGGIAALLNAAGLIDFDLLGITAALVGATAAWMQTKQYLSLASAYSVAARELADIEAIIGETATEEQWAQFVASAEDAISREHILWRASRAGEPLRV